MVEITSESYTREAIDPSFVESIPGIISALAPAVLDIPENERQWVFYGSAPLGDRNTASDVDVMLLHGGSGISPHRRSAWLDSTPVTIYILAHRDLEEDGENRRFGGYFSLKLFSPFVSDIPENSHLLAGSAAHFLGPFSASVGMRSSRASSSDQLLADAYLAFIDLYPDFASYFVRLAQDEARLARVWRHQRRVHVSALRDARYIAQTESGQWKYTGSNKISDVARERSRCVARFWALGAVCHEADPGFPDFYFRKTESHASVSEQQAAIHFLTSVSNGSVRL